jgi:hypothetical protein
MERSKNEGGCPTLQNPPRQPSSEKLEKAGVIEDGCRLWLFFFGVEGGDRDGEDDLEIERQCANCDICASPLDIRSGSTELSCLLSRRLRTFSFCRLSSATS